ncbi:MAG TPA: AfsR/SARP family transcriptional regulator [Euzebyales bacterium]|nr:AfsR/SARP family transcriptional regulator [Euzebyales bacterium]
MHFRLLGPPEVRSRDRHVWFRGHRQRAVFATLALNANRVVTLDRLVDVVWSDHPPPTARTQIQKAVSTLRPLLVEPSADPDRRITTVFPGYVLCCGSDEVDAEVFDREVRQASLAAADGRLPQAAALFRAALGRWYGRALDGVPGLRSAATRLEDQRLLALEDWAAVELSLGRHGELAAELDASVAAHPLRERLRALHMIALYRCGRRAEALQAYRTARRALRDELGLEPGVELRRVERAILTGAPAERLSLEAR